MRFIGSVRTSIARARSAPACCALVLATACGSGPPPDPPPSLYESDPALAQMIADNDGVDQVAPLYSGFAEGEPTAYWDLGMRDAHTMKVYVLCTREDDGACVAIDHPPVADLVPGEPDYSPYERVYEVEVPPGFEGRLRSFEEVDAAVASGAVSEPVATNHYMHCPISTPDAQLVVGPDRTVTPTGRIWVRGLEAVCFDFTSTHRLRPLLSDGTMLVRNVYVLTREGETEPLVEAARMADITGDGDEIDTNEIFGASVHEGDYTPLWRVVTVTVTADYGSIDTYMDQAMADYTSAEDMFTITPDYRITPIEGRVVDYALGETYVDCPLQAREGDL